MCEVRMVPREGIHGERLFVSRDASVAFVEKPDGRRKNVHAGPNSYPNCKVGYNARRKQRYLLFKNVFGHHKHIYVSHAVYEAWVGPIPNNYTIDHLNGITTDNRVENLQPVTRSENNRRAAYLHVLREKIPHHWQTFERENYLRFYAMPLDEFKAMLARYTNTPHPVDWNLTHHCEC